MLPLTAPHSTTWHSRFRTDRGVQHLGGLWREETSTVAVIVVHGLGGNCERPYCIRAARALASHQWSCLRLSLRGADHRGNDFYHAGLTEDLEAAIASPLLAPYERIAILGYSMGGHVALRYACNRPDPRVRAVAAVSSPLDLSASADYLDRRALPAYRRHVLSGLRTMLDALDLENIPSDLEDVSCIREWDEKVVCPRFGFADSNEYYTTQSVAPRLRNLHVPALLVAAKADPMIFYDDIVSAAANANSLFELRTMEAGGHVGFPSGTRLGEDAGPGLEQQVLRWFERKIR